MSDLLFRPGPPPAASPARSDGPPQPRPERPVPGPAVDGPPVPLLAGTGEDDPAESHIVRGID
ncbi:hypothetical protein ACFOOM_33335 [Streptomyces echinoruber]|uniref:Uncharacterized protein n=1 Tax=Streptomyces echinoruber TaxID=68898 RepID=A0A918RHS7_9ACTN|nr:hypothetical protein [Streptomyces echinoruber]GHA00514.1 hypothetical protein GCM10010389_44690 [Streptomyces echinoruber]